MWQQQSLCCCANPIVSATPRMSTPHFSLDGKKVANPIDLVGTYPNVCGEDEVWEPSSRLLGFAL